MAMGRRDFFRVAATAAAGAAGSTALWRMTHHDSPDDPLVVNDRHSRLNRTQLRAVSAPNSLEDVIGIVRRAHRSHVPVCISGSRHAMGGQQFASGAAMIDTRRMNQVIDFDPEKGLVEAEAGIEWPELVHYLLAAQKGQTRQWTIPAKQTGADRLTLGGALSANAHGRSLTKKPMISDIQSLMMVMADGEVIRCSRTQNRELFSLAIGGYGLFGLIHSVVLRLAPRQKIERRVLEIGIEELMTRFEERIKDGFTLGDFQYAIDERSEDFLRKGVFSCYRPVDITTPIPEDQKRVSDRGWNELVYLAHTDKSRAYKLYRDYYLSTDSQVYWADLAQLGGYAEGYHRKLDDRMNAPHPATEMITEIDVPRDRLADFMRESARFLRRSGASVIYGTIRLIEKDDESFLPWAKQDYACVVFNLHVEHTDEGIKKAADAFRGLIDLATERNGSYYLTYHRWATRKQVEVCYPKFREFLSKKLHYDPSEVFQSDWYRHYKWLFRDGSRRAA